jgi:hypothetical protein
MLCQRRKSGAVRECLRLGLARRSGLIMKQQMLSQKPRLGERPAVSGGGLIPFCARKPKNVGSNGSLIRTNYEATCKINKEIGARPEVKQKLSDAISDLKWITNGQEEHRVPETDPIPEGWKKGRLKEGRSFGPKAGTYAYRKITDGTQNRNISLDDPIPDGWRVGMTMKPRAKKGDAQ